MLWISKIINIGIMKKNKYIFVVDLTECIDDVDVFVAIAREKVNAGVPITKFEYNATVGHAVSEAIDSVESIKDFVTEAITKTFAPIANDAGIPITEFGYNATEKETPKKKNIFARFWDWITRKK